VERPLRLRFEVTADAVKAYAEAKGSDQVDRFAALAGRAAFDNLDAFLAAAGVKKLGKAMGSTHKTIYMPDIEAFRIPLPPIDEQHAIVRFLDDRLGRFDELVAATDRSIELLKERRAALITAAVTGQINVHAEGREEQSEPA